MQRSLVIALVSAASFAGPVLGDPGDPRKIEFTLPVRDGFERAGDENRLFFLKPIYGGVDQAGYADYRAGSW